MYSEHQINCHKCVNHYNTFKDNSLHNMQCCGDCSSTLDSCVCHRHTCCHSKVTCNHNVFTLKFTIGFLLLSVITMLAIFLAYPNVAFANDDNSSNPLSTYVDSVRFVQYLDENTALEEVRGGNLDMYYFRISSDRLDTHDSRAGLNVYESAGGSYSLLINPAVSDDSFNPFQDPDVRFAVNYLIDRRLIVNDLMGGYGMPIISHYGPSDPEYLTVIDNLASLDFEYNPTLADSIISERLYAMGATKNDDHIWHMDSEPVTLIFFIRSDDPVRKSIGEVLASEFEQMGFVVKKEFGDLNKAFVVVYGSDPATLRWSLYTEGWAKSAFTRYDSTGLAQMYSPWFSNMPGFNDPSYWNYENEKLDNLTRRIYTGNFTDEQERAVLIREAVLNGVTESVRIFLASNVDQYVTHTSVSGIVNDFGAGLPSRFTPINARIIASPPLSSPPLSPSPPIHSENDNLTIDDHIGGELRVGVKQIYQGSWNPVMGFRDAYSAQIGTLLSDPATFLHPFTGEVIPVRVTWNVTTAGPLDVLDVADDAVLWSPIDQKWTIVDSDANATSIVWFKYKLGNWHNGVPMDMLDIMHSFYFSKEWGTQTGPDDATFDTEFTSIVAPSVDTIKGIRPLSNDTLEVYVDYWHFDEGEIAQWAAPGVSMPWEMISAMESAVMDGKTSFSRSGAASKGTSWLSVIIPTDVEILRGYLESMRNLNHVPKPLSYLDSGLPLTAFDSNITFDSDMSYYASRYDSAISWIDDTGHAMIGNGPFYLDSYSPESRSIRIISFNDKTYPFERDEWSGFERAAFPLIVGVDIKNPILKGEQLHVDVATIHSDSLLYFLINASGHVIASSTYDVISDDTLPDDVISDDAVNYLDNPHNDDMAQFNSTYTKIIVSVNDTAHMSNGANSIRIFALSDTVLKPDYYETGFLAFGFNETDFVLTPVLPSIQGATPSDVSSDINTRSDDILSSQPTSHDDITQPDKDDYTNVYYLMLVVGIVSIALVIIMRVISKVRKID